MKKVGDAMKMVRGARDEPGAIRRKSLKGYLRQIEESNKELIVRHKRLIKDTKDAVTDKKYDACYVALVRNN